ncbi:haloacid dehalogenase-like hydrolase [Lactococcus muris]|uniref:Haloacid dehalogenase-like hydrolase n=1 Tax=Lactococcus muris TaxID=2941330 RepID=A0ABV4D5H1_9LACT|nr:haloacid dehalogenase-like hydrolase [Lactococcus garvieae]
MKKRFISAQVSEIFDMNALELKNSIKASEGRVICSENVAARDSNVGEVSNSEIARAFGADLILLNGFDVFDPQVSAIEGEAQETIHILRQYVGRPIGANLEPVDLEAEMSEVRDIISLGRQANKETLAEAKKLGLDFVCLTGNPGTGVTNSAIVKAITVAKEEFGGLIIAGKMHGAGVDEAVVDMEAVKAFVKAGADVILVPAVGTVPGFDVSDLKAVVKVVHEAGALVMSAIGTSQESSDADTIKQIAIQNKICGVDIQHIGDAGYSGIAPVENIMAMSKAIRGNRHTIAMVAKSIRR